MNFTREQKSEAFDNLPKDLKAVVMSNTLAKSFEDLGNQNNLPVDKTGILSELILVTMLGLLPRENFQANVKSELGVSDLQASTITKSVNDNIFLRIREILQKEEELQDVNTGNMEEIKAPVTENKEISAFPELKKEEILNEIENPTPTVHPISIADQTVPGPAKPVEIISQPKAPEPTKESVAKEFVAGKMTETVNLPRQKYTVDPYREPIE